MKVAKSAAEKVDMKVLMKVRLWGYQRDTIQVVWMDCNWVSLMVDKMADKMVDEKVSQMAVKLVAAMV